MTPIIPDEELKKRIQEQIAFNKGKNVFTNVESKTLGFIEDTASFIDKIRNIDVQSEKSLVDYLTDESLQEFCRVNQFFSFNSESIEELKAIYFYLNKQIRLLDTQAAQAELDNLSEQHYQKLCDWLVRTNKFSEKMYSNDQEIVQPVACSEYTPDLQLNIFQIDFKTMRQPVLDVGCGREMNLVNFLRDNGVEAYGIDRFDNNSPFYIKSDWLEFGFEANKWGTIISNLGFSNHFIHHNLRADGNFRAYAQKYMEILASLENEGSFYYAPELPFVETYLDIFTYQCRSIAMSGSAFKASHITKIS